MSLFPLLIAVAAAAAPALPHDVPFRLGDIELDGKDRIEITSVRGDRATFEIGGTYEVQGRYALTTRQQASLVLSVTTSGPPVPSPAHGNSHVRVNQGKGTFSLTMHLAQAGWPHVTLYDVDSRAPFSGVYFGEGAFLLEKKSWRYLSEPEAAE